MLEGRKEWDKLIAYFKPDVIIFSIPQDYAKMVVSFPKDFIVIDKTKDGLDRKPVVIKYEIYNGALAIFRTSCDIPFGNIGTKQKEEIGKLILKYLNK